MKISRGIKFVPIVVTLEDLREARVLLSALIIGIGRMRLDVDPFDECIIDSLIKALRSEGITGI
jgi:hypothetical protein